MKSINPIKSVFIFLVLVFIDQFSKYLIRHTGGFYVCNKDVAFGIKVSPIIFWGLWILIIVLLINLKRKNQNEKLQLKTKSFEILKFGHWGLIRNWKLEIRNYNIYNAGIILILSGAISNAIDRIIHNCVIDFIDLKIWPVFNLADSYITIGAVIIIFSLLKKQKIS